jgi:hypothetical protein
MLEYHRSAEPPHCTNTPDGLQLCESNPDVCAVR